MDRNVSGGAVLRYQHLDLMKGLAVMAMIQVHLTELFSVPSWQESVGGHISLFIGGPAAAPLFMVVMGYLAAQGKRASSGIALRGLKLMLWGLLLNIGLNFHLLIRIFFDGWKSNPLHYILGVDILFLAGLSLMLIALAKAVGKFEAVLAFILMVGFSAAAYLKPWPGTDNEVVDYLMAFVHSDVSWSYFPLVPWAAYPLAGFIAARLFMSQTLMFHRERTYWFIMLIGVLLISTTFRIGWEAATNLTLWYHHQIPVIIWNLVFVATLSAAAKLIIMAFEGRPAVKFLSWTGRHVTAFYVFQWLIIGNLATSIYQTRYPLQLLFWFIAITAASAGLTWSYNRAKAKFRRQMAEQEPKS
jgi:uncharacterized membrane protein